MWKKQEELGVGERQRRGFSWEVLNFVYILEAMPIYFDSKQYFQHIFVFDFLSDRAIHIEDRLNLHDLFNNFVLPLPTSFD